MNASILNVDDNAAGRYAVTRVLRQAGFEVQEAATGNDTLRMAAARTFQLVILDVNLPDLSGFEVCRKLKADPRTSYLPVLHLSATSVTTQHRVEGLDGGADGYLTQPIDPEVLVATVRSLLRMRQAEEALRRSEERFRRLAESNVIGITSGQEDLIVDANDAFLTMLGYSRSDLKNGLLKYSAIIAPESVERDAIAKEEVLARGACSAYEKQYTRKDGTTVPALVGVAALENKGWVEFVVDLTERKRLEYQLYETQKLESLGLLSAGIAHDFNNLLTGIMGSTSMLLDKAKPGTQEADVLTTVLEASERAAELVRQILAYSGKGRYSNRRLVVSDAIHQIADILYAALPAGVSLEMDLPGDLPEIQADRNQIQQVAINLVTNGAEAIEPDTGEVKLRAGVKRINRINDFALAPGNYVYIEVVDTGCGMDAETQAKMFDPFFSTKFIGRGLGLAAVSGIVRSHKGAIQVESASGKGSAIRVFLPVAV